MEIAINHLSESDYHKLGISDWPIWEKEISVFEWNYEETEQFYLIEGLVQIKTEQGNFDIKPGDFVECSKGLHCKWEIKEYVKKHYHFIDE